jgi:hypothetical protein
MSHETLQARAKYLYSLCISSHVVPGDTLSVTLGRENFLENSCTLKIEAAVVEQKA